MKIPLEIRQKYLLRKDPEAEFFLDLFDEELKRDSLLPKQVLEVGANDNYLASMFKAVGYDISSVDLMPYTFIDVKHPHYVGDFCEFGVEFWQGERFDIIYSISAIEHFGLGTYNKENYRPYHDVLAMRYIYDLLKPDGVAYVAVPFAGKFVELRPHWRTYDYEALTQRIVQDFNVELFETRVVEWNLPECGQRPSAGFVAKLTKGEPYVSCLLKLRKGKKNA